MNKSKWYAKLLSLAVVFALVVSLVGIAVVPAGAQAASPLVVDVTTENTTYCCSTNFTVTAMITVPAAPGPATNVSATISWNPGSGLDLISPPATQLIASIGAGNSTPVTWEVHCNEPDPVIITVTVTADTPYGAPVSDQWWIEQTSANLFTDIIWPEDDTAVMECTTFNLTFDIINDGCRGANNIRVTVDPGLYTEVVVDEEGQGAGNIYTIPSFSLGSDSSRQFVLDLHCVEVGTDTIHVNIPYARDGCTDLEIHGVSDLVGIIQYEELVVACNVTPQLTKTGYNVTFTADATGGISPYTWSWDFGDTIGTSSNQNDVYAYPNPGTYYPEVTVTDSWFNTANCTSTVEVRAHPTITSCNATPNPTKIGYNTTFTATAIDGIGPYTWAWDFETDGTKDVTGLADPTYVWAYLASGTYNATVYMSDAWANNATCNVTVEVREHPLIEVCGANYTPTKVGVDTTFTATVIGGVGPYNWVWDFDNGDIRSDTTLDPPPSISNVLYSYSVPGTYNVTVNVTDALDNPASCNFTLEVKDHPAIIACNATPPETKVDDEVYFDAWVIGGVPNYKWSWDVDDDDSEDFAQTTAGTNSHVGPFTYSTPGTYNVSVSLLDKFENPASCNFTIVVHPSLNVSCEVEPDPALVCHAVNFTAEKVGGVPGNPYIWEWEFKDSEGAVIGTASTQNTTFAFMCVGNYSGTVTVTDELLGNTANCTANVTVIIEPPELILPILNAQLTSKNVTFEWEDIGCCNYTLEVWQKEEGGQKVLLVETGKDNTWTGPIFNGEWRWHVTATESCNVSATSDTWFFRVDQPGTAVTVMSPNGGEVWQSGDSHAITWTAVPTDGVIDIYYSSDNGASWTLIKSGEVNDGAYPWTVPSLDSAQCLVRIVVTDAATGTAQDTSDGVFTITTDLTDPIVTVTNPNGGESYAGGSTQSINWTASDNVAVTSIDLYFSSNGGAEWAIIATGEANDGTYSWTVPGVESDQCLVKVEASDAAGNVGSDTSDTVFSITITEETPPSVTVKAPNGGETLVGGTNATITWKASDYWPTSGFGASDSDLTIDIYYQYDGGVWTPIATGEANDGAYLWTVPDINSTQCLIKVDATDAAGNVGSDASDGVFTITAVAPPSDITAPTVTVTRPNGGETFIGASQEFILWSASDDVTLQGDLTVNLYYKVGSGSWIAIAAGEDNDGAYKWDVPEINDAQCLIRVDAVDEASNVGSDISDDEFAIITGVVVSIPDTAVSANTSAIVPININGVTDLASVDIWLSYDKDVVTVANVTAGTLGAVSFSIDNTSGVTKINWFMATGGKTGDFVFANVELQAVGSAGEFSALDLDVKGMSDPDGDPIAHSVEDGVFTILALMEGDANLDSHVTIVDAMFVAQHLIGYRTLNADQLICADTFGDDGTVDIADAMYIARWLVDPTTPLWDAVDDAGMVPPVP